MKGLGHICVTRAFHDREENHSDFQHTLLSRNLVRHFSTVKENENELIFRNRENFDFSWRGRKTDSSLA